MPILNDLEYHVVSDGYCMVDGGGAFGLVPKIVWQTRIAPNEHNLIPFMLHCLLIKSEGKTIVVDTGYGNKLPDKAARNAGLIRDNGDLLADLARHGVQPTDVDIVINTHLHGDHCSGNTMLVDGNVAPTFPNAEYLVQRLEYADAVAPNERTRATYFPDNYVPLYQSGQLRLLNGDTRITRHVRTAVARGHTRAHQMVILEEGDQTILFIADLCGLHYHLERLAWVPGYDVEPLETIESKRYWQQWILERDALVIFQHDPQITFGRLRQDGKRLKVVNVGDS